MDEEQRRCHREYMREYMREYYKCPEARAKIRASQKVYYQRNKDKVKKQSREWQIKHAEHRKEYMLNYRKGNREKWNILANKIWHRRRAKILMVPTESISIDVLFDRDNGICGICGKAVKRSGERSIDHIIPLSMGGHHIWSNVQLAHLKCNMGRGAGRYPSQLKLGLNFI